jgi:tRNA (guanine-N7-)-methyltransferase
LCPDIECLAMLTSPSPDPIDTVIFKPSSWVDPIAWNDVFATAGPVEVEIGAGKGTFLLWAAQDRSGSNFLGVERRLDRLRKIDRKARRLNLRNVRVLRLEAGYLVGKLIPDRSVDVYHILFPDPWPKRRHANNRLIQPSFVKEMHRTLRPGGAVNLATDSADYFGQMQRVMGESGLYTVTKTEELPEEARTDFERDFIAAGKPIYRCRYLAV